MRVHVTGAAGFVGGHLIPALARAGYDMQPVLSGAQAVVHLAGIAHRRARGDELQEVNVRLTERLARRAAAEGARFVFVSSVKVHGERSREPFTERSPIHPEDAYAQSKALAEERLRAIAGLTLTVLRPPLVYGPGVKANFLALMQAIDRRWPLPFASLDNRRSFIYVGNLADTIIRCLHAEGTFLVSDATSISTPQLCAEIGEALGRPARLFPFPPSLLPRKLAGSLEVNDSLIRRTLGWQPPYTRAQGLKATADWYRAR